MKRFRFRLETVLKMRRQREHEQQRRVAEVVRVCEQCEDRLRELAAAKESCAASLRDLTQPGQLDMLRVAALRFHSSQLDFQRAALHEKLGLVHAELDRRRRDLAEASKNRQVMEKLRERQADEHRRDFEKSEQAVLDEVATVQCARNTQGARHAEDA